jgi:hypothetical protein
MTTCPSCKRSVAANVLICPNCGAVLSDTSLPTEVLPPSKQREAPRPDERRKQSSQSVADSADGARFATGTMLTERYRIVSLLGRGGMGEVYKAEDLKLKQIVALKFLPEAITQDGAALARFHNEVRITRQISHPNVCRVYDIAEVDGRHFLSMEFIDGEDLSVLLRRIGRLPGDKATEIARQLCAGLAAAHDTGVLHRDLKPANVMIDGRGKARITDFGLAVAAAELNGKEAVAGTPGYMAPEQLANKQLTQRSDIYSLGLVLYELFTGKRVFESNNLHDVMKLHETSAPTSPSSHVKDIDPLVEKVILRCLEKDPSKRPSSAIQVAAALPGGDPLAAALAAGETPSPEMVAAAGEKTGLRPVVAVACLAAIMVGLIIYAFLSNRVNWQAQVMHENSPDALGHKANEIIQRLGYTNRPTDTASGLRYHSTYLRYLEQNSASSTNWSVFIRAQPSPIFFWYRQSPRYLEVAGWGNGGWVSEDDPPHDVSGMVSARLDSQGRLIRFTAVPPQVDESSEKPPPPDWAPLLAAAGFDPAKLTSTEAKWTAPTAFDARAAWTGVYADRPEISLRIEAAAYRGKPVYFQIVGPWTQPSRMQAIQPSTRMRVQYTIDLLSVVMILLVAVLLARHNVRKGRGDRRGAFRLALFIFAVSILAWIFGANHAPTRNEIFRFFVIAVSLALLLAGLFWLVYLALEPYVRRRWPNTIIAWSRVLSGNLRDPLVGRDVLVGILVGIIQALIYWLEDLVRFLLNSPPQWDVPLDAWIGLRYLIASGFMINSLNSILFALFLFSGMFLFRALTRRQWLATGIFFSIGVVQSVLGSSQPMVTLPFACFLIALAIIVLLRFGFLAFVISLFVNGLLLRVPITTNFSAWYASSFFVVLIAVMTLAAFAFHTSLGGRKLFEGKLLDE